MNTATPRLPTRDTTPAPRRTSRRARGAAQTPPRRPQSDWRGVRSLRFYSDRPPFTVIASPVT